MYDAKKSDMWSCGVMLYFMLFARIPFQASTDNQRRPTVQQVIDRYVWKLNIA